MWPQLKDKGIDSAYIFEGVTLLPLLAQTSTLSFAQSFRA